LRRTFQGSLTNAATYWCGLYFSILGKKGRVKSYPTSDSIGGLGNSCCEPGFSISSCGAPFGGLSSLPGLVFFIKKTVAAVAIRLPIAISHLFLFVISILIEKIIAI